MKNAQAAYRTPNELGVEKAPTVTIGSLLYVATRWTSGGLHDTTNVEEDIATRPEYKRPPKASGT